GALAPDWDHSLGFVPGTLPVPRILTLASDADGRVVAGGTFARWRTRAGPIELPWLARVGADGIPDPSFTPATISGGEVRDVALLPDGGMAVAGSFTAPSERFTVLAASGEIAPGFQLSEPPSLRVRAALPLPGGSFLIGGDFTNIGDRLAHILADGTRDPTFTLGANNDVNCLAFAPDGRITIGGLFTTINGVPRRRLARLNPDLSPDESFRSDGLDDEVNSLAISGGHLLAGGNFESPHRLLARMFGDGKAPDDTLQLIRSPLGRMMPAGGALDLTVAVAPVRSDQQFLWTRNGEELARSSHPRLSVDRITPEQSGVYRVEVSDITGSTLSQPIRVQVTQPLPGGEAEFRYRGTGTVISGDAVTSAPLDVPDAFSIRNVRLSLELTHPDTSQLEIFLISPDGISVRLFNDKGRRGRDLHATTFDDSAGGDASIDDAQPPYTGTYQPDKPLSPMLAARSSGRWTLRVENGSPAAGDLLDWMLELRAGAAQVSFSNYANALGLPDNDESRHAYSLARLPQDESSGVRALGTSPAGFAIGHWRWTSPSDLNYSYERNVPAGWAPAVPTGGYITRFPGGREYHEARFPNLSSRSYFRLRADPTP
ncbi:MAG: proprotein convertase P-domain-containing protein, partial [Verrucomicrobiales bacterium]